MYLLHLFNYSCYKTYACTNLFQNDRVKLKEKKVMNSAC